MATKDQATVGLEVVLQYDENSIQKALNSASDEIRRKVDIPSLAAPIQAGVEEYVKKLSNAFSNAAKALSGLGDDVISPTDVENFRLELKNFKEIREEFRAFVKTAASITGVDSVKNTIKYINELQVVIDNLGSRLVNQLQVIPSATAYDASAKAVKDLERALDDVNRRIATFNKYMADAAINQGIVLPTGSPVAPTIPVSSAQVVEVTKQQIEAIRENTIALGGMTSATDALMSTLTQNILSGPLKDPSDIIALRLQQIEQTFSEMLSKFAIFDLETGVYKTDRPLNPDGTVAAGSLEMITSMAIQLGNKAIEAFKVDFSEANHKTAFFFEHLEGQLKDLPLKDLRTELHRLADEIRALGLTLVGFNSKTFDEKVLIENIKATGDATLLDKWKAIIAESQDVMVQFKQLLLSTLPRLVEDPTSSRGLTGTSLDAIRTILLQMNQAHLASDDVFTTKLALITTLTEEGRKLFANIMLQQGGIERWLEYVGAKLTDKYSLTSPLKDLDTAPDAAYLKGEIEALITAFGGLRNVSASLMHDLNIPTNVINELVGLKLAYDNTRTAEIEKYKAGIEASRQFIKTLEDQSSAVKILVQNGAATAAALEGVTETLKQLKTVFQATFGPTGLSLKDINGLLDNSAINTLASSFGLDLEGLLNKLFAQLNSQLERALTGSEIADILGRTKDIMHATLQQLADDFEATGGEAQRALDRETQAVNRVAKSSGELLDEINGYLAEAIDGAHDITTAAHTLVQNLGTEGVSIEVEAKKTALLIKENMAEMALMAEALAGGLEVAINAVLKSGNIGLSPVPASAQLAANELSKALQESALAVRQETRAREAAERAALSGKAADEYRYLAGMFHLTAAELEQFKKGLAEGTNNLNQYAMIRQNRGNDTENFIIEVLKSSQFISTFAKETGEAFQLLDTQVRISAGAFNYAIDVLAKIGNKLAVFEIKDTDNLSKINDFLNNPASQQGKQWLAQGLMYREWMDRLVQEQVDLYFILVNTTKDAVRLTGDVIQAIKKIDFTQYAGEVNRIYALLAQESGLSLTDLNIKFEDPNMLANLRAKIVQAQQSAAMITISAGLVADDVINFSKLITRSLEQVGGDLQKLYINTFASLEANKPTDLSGAAAKFFNIGNFAEAFNRLMTILVSFDGASATTDKLNSLLSGFRVGELDTTGFTSFVEGVKAQLEATVSYTTTMATIQKKLNQSNSESVATLRSLISTLSTTPINGVTIDQEYIKLLEEVTKPIQKLLADLKKAANKTGSEIPAIVEELNLYIEDLTKMRSEIATGLRAARKALSVASVATDSGEIEEAVDKAQKALKQAFATQIAYVDALANFQAKGFDDAIAAVKALLAGDKLLPNSESINPSAISDAQQRIIKRAADLAAKLGEAIFSPDLLKEAISVFKAALKAGMSSIPGVSFNDIVQQATALNASGSLFDTEALNKTVSVLLEIGQQLANQAKLLEERAAAVEKENLTLEQQQSLESRLTGLAAGRLDAEAGVLRLLQAQAEVKARLTGSSGGGGGTVPPTGNLPVPSNQNPQEPSIIGINWDELSKRYTKAIASITLETTLYGESLDALRGKEKAAQQELERIIGLLGSSIGNKFLTEEEIGFKKLSEEIQIATSRLEHFQKMADSYQTKAADLNLQAQVLNSNGFTDDALKTNIKAQTALAMSAKYQEEFQKLRQQLADSAAEQTLQDMKEQLTKIFAGKFDFAAPENLVKAQEKLKTDLKTAQENLLQKAVDNFAVILSETFNQQALDAALKINTQAFKSGVTTMPQGNPSDLLKELSRLPYDNLPTNTGSFFNAKDIQAALEALRGMDATFKSITTGSAEADAVIKKTVEDASKLLTVVNGTGSSSAMSKEFLAAEQAIQKTVAESKNLENVYKNLLLQLETINKELGKEGISSEEVTALEREKLKVEQSITQALESQASLATRVKGEIEALIAAGKNFAVDYRSVEAAQKAHIAGLEKLAEEEANLVKKKIELQGQFTAALEKGVAVDEKLVADLIKLNNEISKAGLSPVGMSNQDIKSQTKTAEATNAKTTFATDIIDFAVWQVEWAAAASVVQGFFDSISKGIETVIEFESVVNKMAVISQATALETKQLSEQLVNLSKVTPYSVKELGEGLIILGQAGFNAAESMKLLPAVANLATASLESLKTAADIMTTAIEAYQLKVSDANQVANVMNATAIESKLDLSQVGTAFNYVASTAATAGLSIGDTNAALGLMANAGLRASTAGTSLRSALGVLMAPTAAFSAELAKVGLTTEDVNPRIHDLGQILQKMRDAGFNTEMAFAGLDKRMAAGMITLVQHSDQWATFKDRIENGTTAAEQAEKQMYTFENASKALNHSFQGLAITIGESTLGPMGLLAKAAQIVVDAITGIVHAIPDSIKQFTLMTVGLGVGASALSALVKGFQEVRAASNLAAVAQGAETATAALTGTGKTIAALSDKLRSLSTIFLNPTTWAWVAGITAGTIALSAAVNELTGASDMARLTTQINNIESQLKTVQALASNVNKANPNAAINVDIQNRLKMEGFDVPLDKLDQWITRMNIVLDDLKVMQQEVDLSNSVNWWAQLKLWFNSLGDAQAALEEAAAKTQAKAERMMKSKNAYYDDDLFQKELDQLSGQDDISKKARADLLMKRRIAMEEDANWYEKAIAEQNARVEKLINEIKLPSATDIVKQFNLTFMDDSIYATLEDTKSNAKQVQELVAYLNSIGAIKGNDVDGAIKIYLDAVNGVKNETLTFRDGVQQAQKDIAEMQLLKDAATFKDGKGKINGLSAAFNALQKKVTAEVNDFITLNNNLEAKKAELAQLMTGPQTYQTVYDIARVEAEIGLMMTKLENSYGKLVNDLKQFFEKKLINELGAQMAAVVKGLAPLAGVGNIIGDSLQKEAGGISLQELNSYYTKLAAIQKSMNEIKNSISNEMRLELGTKGLQNLDIEVQAKIKMAGVAAVDKKRIQELVASGVDEARATAQATTEAIGQKVIEYKLQLWAALRMKDATDEARTTAASHAQKYFDIAQKAMDDITKNNNLQLNLQLNARTFSTQVATELGITEKTLQNFALSAQTSIETANRVFTTINIPTFSDAQASLLRLSNSFKASEDQFKTFSASYAAESATLSTKVQNSLNFLSQAYADGGVKDDLFQKKRTEILRTAGEERLALEQKYSQQYQQVIQAEIQQFQQLVAKMNEFRTAGMDSANFFTNLANSIVPAAAISMEELRRQIQQLSSDARDAAARGDKQVVSSLQSTISSILSANGELVKGDQILADDLKKTGIAIQDAFEYMRSQAGDKLSDISGSIQKNYSEWSNLQNKMTGTLDTATKDYTWTIDVDGNMVAQEIVTGMTDGVKGTLQEVRDLTQQQLNMAVTRTNQELDAMIKVPDTIAQANRVAQDNLLELGISFKSLREQAEILTSKFGTLAQAANIPTNANGAPISARDMKVNISGDLRLTGNNSGDFNFSQVDLSKIADAVTQNLTKGLVE